jgi:hypothetical protein
MVIHSNTLEALIMQFVIQPQIFVLVSTDEEILQIATIQAEESTHALGGGKKNWDE